MNDVFVFLGPTLSMDDAKTILPHAIFLDPVSQGDISALLKDKTPKVIAIIDGYFEGVPSVWHKEILEALSGGVHVFGASSMGALRAAELDAFGMIGVGEIYTSYKHKILTDDDEVAVLHGPKDIGYPLCSDAMVSIRKTMELAFINKITTEESYNDIIETAKTTFYKNRLYADIISRSNLREAEKIILQNWVKQNAVDLKREDALLLLRQLANLEIDNKNMSKFHFNKTIFWQKSRIHTNATL